MPPYVCVPMKSDEGKWVKLVLPIDFLRLPDVVWIWDKTFRDAYVQGSDPMCPTRLTQEYWRVTGEHLYFINSKGAIRHVTYYDEYVYEEKMKTSPYHIRERSQNETTSTTESQSV